MGKMGYLRALAMAAVLVPAAPWGASAAGSAADFASVVVNGRVVSPERLRLEIKAQQSAGAVLHGNAQADGGKKAAGAAVERLIERELLLDAAARRGLSASAAEVEQAWQREIGRWASAEMFEKSLTIRGITREYLRERIAEDVLMHKLVDPMAQRPELVPEEALRQYQQSHRSQYADPSGPAIRYIHFSNAGLDGESRCRERLDSFQKRFNKGELFANLAREYSDHPSAAQDGLIDATQPLPFIEDARKLIASQFSTVHVDNTGMHIYCRDREARLVPLEKVREDVRLRAAGEMTVKRQREFLAELRKLAVIEYR